MKNVVKYIRVEEWMSSKVTMMVGILMYFLLLSGCSVKTVVIDVFVYFLFISMFLAISYVVNDFSDLEIDKKVGKKKVIANMTKTQIWLSLICMFMIGNIPLFYVVENKKLVIALIVIIYLLGISYSAPGIRFKERGALGLVECSFAQRCMPLSIICLFINMNYKMDILLGIWIAISMLDGFRYILIHQIIDMENDIKSGVQTFIVKKKKNYRNVVISFLVTEVILCATVMAPLFQTNKVLVVLFVLVNVYMEYSIYNVLCKYAQKDWLACFDSVPLEAFLNIFMPAMVGFLLIAIDVRLVVLPILNLMICCNSLKIKLDLVKVYLNINQQSK